MPLECIGYCTCECGVEAAVYMMPDAEPGDVASPLFAECHNGHRIPEEEMHNTFSPVEI